MDIKAIKEKYYNNYILDKILQEIYFKEDGLFRSVSILNNQEGNKKVAFRGITFSSRYFLWKTFFQTDYNFGTINNDSNMYCTVARIIKLPQFPFNPIERRKHTSEFYSKHFKEYIKHYDIYIDYDLNNKDYQTFISDVFRAINFFESNNLHFECVFSGSRGFKFLIWNNAYTYKSVERIQHNIMKLLKSNFIDDRGVLVPSKLMKINFSLCVKGNQTPKIVYPLKRHNFKKFCEIIAKYETFKIFDYNNADIKHLAESPVYTSPFNDANVNDSTPNFRAFVKKYDLLKA